MKLMKKADLEIGKEYVCLGEFVKVLEVNDIEGDEDETCDSVLVETRFVERTWIAPSELSHK